MVSQDNRFRTVFVLLGTAWTVFASKIVTIKPTSIQLVGKTQDKGGTDEIQILTYGRGREGCLSGKHYDGSDLPNCDWYGVYSGVEDNDELAKKNERHCDRVGQSAMKMVGPDCEGYKKMFVSLGAGTEDIWPYTAMTSVMEVKADQTLTDFKVRPRLLLKRDGREIRLFEKDPLISETTPELSITTDRIKSYYKLFEEGRIENFEVEFTFGFPQSAFDKLVQDNQWLGEFASAAVSPFCISHVDFKKSQSKFKTDKAKAKALGKGLLKSLGRKAVKAALVAGHGAGKDKATIRKELFDENVPGGRAANDQLNSFLDEQEFCVIEAVSSNEANYVVKFLVEYVDEEVGRVISAGREVARLQIAIQFVICVFLLCM